MTLFAVFKLLHLASAMWLVSGLLGRAVALAATRRYSDVAIVKSIADVSGRLENLMIAPGYILLIVTGVATALAGGYSLFGPLSGGPWWVFLGVLYMIVGTVITPFVVRADAAWGKALEESVSLGRITDRLRGYLERGALIRRYAPDIVVVALVVALMVLKPF